MLKKLYIDNYRSFSDTTIEFGQFNCLIGPNNAGKSNLIDALEFLDFILFTSVDEAVKEKSSQLIENYRLNKEEITINAEFELAVSGRVDYDAFTAKFKLTVQTIINTLKGTFAQDVLLNGKCKHIAIDSKDFRAFFEGSEMSSELDFGISEEQINNYDKYKAKYDNSSFKPFKLQINLSNNSTRVSFGDKQSNVLNRVLLEFFCRDYGRDAKGNIAHCDIDFDSMLISSRLLGSYFFNTLSIKNDLKYGKELDKYGRTLINYLSLLQKYRKDVFDDIAASFIGEVELVNGMESSVNYNLPKLELVEFGAEYPIDYRSASEGTIHFLAIMTAIKAVDERIIAIEEPERSLHMKTLNYIVEQCRNSAKQIFITTHSSELLRMLKPNEISFVYRDRDGNSKVKMASKIPYLPRMMKRTKYDIVELIQTGILGDFEDDE